MAAPQVNGDVPNSAHSSVFLEHLLSYPIIKDGIQTFQSNGYAQKSIQLGDSAYKTFATPVLPWLAKPYGYVSPYVQKADSFGAKTLDRIDEQFPVVKKPTSDLYNDTKTLIWMPYQKGLEGKAHVLEIYTNERKKSEQQSIVSQGKAAVTTVLVVSNETLAWISNLLTTKKAEVTQVAREKINQ